MKKFIIITSIFAPTDAVRKFAGLPEYNLIVVGDKKSPAEYDCDGATFLSVDKSLSFNLEKALPFNHYCRKMLGYVYAVKSGADMIIDTDDDNIPLDGWGFPEFGRGGYDSANSADFVNIYGYFTKQKIWPRGLPLRLINSAGLPELKVKTANIGIWQGLADSDPDVDAIYRLTDNSPCIFDKTRAPIVLDRGTFCPFNSQNTAFCKDLFPLLYLPATVTFRFTDILRGLVAQPIMQIHGFSLGFTTATVVQERNEHDYTRDFESEIPCYLQADKVIQIVSRAISADNTVSKNLTAAYRALFENGIVALSELEILSAWIKDLEG